MSALDIQAAGDACDLFQRGRTATEPIVIYQDSIRAQFLRTLLQIYPVARQLVGDAFYDFMGREYIASHASTSADLNDYGADFAAFAQDFEPAQSVVYLADVMRLEWAWHRAFNAPDPHPGNIDALVELDATQYSRVVLYLHPSATLLSSPHPVHRIWEMHQPEAPPVMNVSLDEGGVNLIVWRDNLDMHIDAIPEQQWDFVSGMAAGASLGELADTHSLVQASNFLATLLPRGFIFSYDLH